MPDQAVRRAGMVLMIGLVLGSGGNSAVWAQGEAEGLSNRFRQASRQALPAVVTVRPQGGASGAVLEGEALDRLLRAGGSGVVVDAGRGLVVTNDHVIAGASRGVVVILGNGRERPVSQVWRDPKSDLALLAIDPADLVAAPWGDSNRLDIGDWVLAIGGPFGLTGSVTAGIVSGKGRGIGMALYEDLIQTDAAINPGNSGGPLINLQGEVVGISTALKSNGGGYEGVGFAIPASRARRVVAELAEFGRVRRAYLGITVRPIDPATAARLNLTEGAVVSSVVAGSPAAQAGLVPGDVILSVGGLPTGGSGTLQAAVEVARVGEPLNLTIDRNGQVFPLQVRPEAQPDRYGLSSTTPGVIAETAPVPVEAMVARRRGVHINVPGLNMFVPGPNLDVTPFGVSRAPRAVLVAPPAYETVVPGSVAAPVVVAPPVAVAPVAPVEVAPPNAALEPELTPLTPVPASAVAVPPVPVALVPTQPPAIETSSRAASFPSLGVNLAEPTPSLTQRYKLPRDTNGLVVTSVSDDGPADRGGLEPGMVLTDAAGKMVGNVADFRQILASRPAGRDLLVRIKKGTKSEFRVVVAPPTEKAIEPTEPPLDPLPPAASRPL